MKTTRTLKAFGDLPSGIVHPMEASAAAQPKPEPLREAPEHPDSVGDRFRAMLHRRATERFPSANPHHGWGLNE